jgi:hypothetical protein
VDDDIVDVVKDAEPLFFDPDGPGPLKAGDPMSWQQPTGWWGLRAAGDQQPARGPDSGNPGAVDAALHSLRSSPSPSTPTTPRVKRALTLLLDNARLREVVAARDGEIEALRYAKDVEVAGLRAVVRAQDLRIAGLERRLGAGSDDSGTPSLKGSIEAGRGARRSGAGGVSGTRTLARERSPGRARGGLSGHAGQGLTRDPDPNQRWMWRRRRRSVGVAGPGWWVRGTRGRPGRRRGRCGWCGGGWSTCCPGAAVPVGCVDDACPPTGAVNGIWPVLNSAPVALTAFGNVATERAATPADMLYGQAVSAGFVARANGRLAEALTGAGFEEAMKAAFTGHLIVDGYAAYQKLLGGAGAVLAGIQQCCQHYADIVVMPMWSRIVLRSKGFGLARSAQSPPGLGHDLRR